MTAAVLVLLVPLVTAPAATAGPCQAAAQTREAQAIAQFDARVGEYVALHRRLEGPVPAPQVSDDMRVVTAAMDALAAQIAAARRSARRGDLFTPDVAPVLRARIARCLPPDEMELIITEREEEDPLEEPSLEVNGRWPAGSPFRFVPPQLIAALPRLPQELQYRIVGHTLVLWDHHADLIVDVMPDAFAKVTLRRPGWTASAF